MTRKTISSVLLVLALTAMSALQASAQSLSQLVLLYDDLSGNLALQNTTSGSLPILEFTVNTKGDGTFGDPSGLTVGAVTNSGYLYTGTNNLPPSSFPSNNYILGENTNGLWSTSGASNVVGAVFTLNANPGWDAGSPQKGPAGSFWDLGNITVTGMTDLQLADRFITNPDLTGTLLNKKFTYIKVGSPGLVAGDVVRAVPEPSTYAMAFAGLVSCGFSMWRKRRTA